MNIENLYKKFRENWESFKDRDKIGRYKYLTSLIDSVNLLNPHYLRKLPKRFFYDLVKKKFDVFANELNFKCRTCEDNCCFFSETEFLIKEIGIYKEDYELLEDNNVDLNGYVVVKNSNEYDYFKNIMKHKLSFPELIAFKEKVLSVLGYVKNLNIIEKKGKFQCYYYDEIKRKCKIHKYKPIVCYTFPIRITNSWNKVGLQFCEDCFYMKDMIKEHTYEGYHDKCNAMQSFWEYNISVILFLKYKDRTENKNGIISYKEPEKYELFRHLKKENPYCF